MNISESRTRFWASVLLPLAIAGVLAFFLPAWVVLIAVAAILLWPRR